MGVRMGNKMAALLSLFQQSGKEGYKPLTRGVCNSNPIYIPRRHKLKGYEKNNRKK